MSNLSITSEYNTQHRYSKLAIASFINSENSLVNTKKKIRKVSNFPLLAKDADQWKSTKIFADLAKK
jgi:hypothetical protein